MLGQNYNRRHKNHLICREEVQCIEEKPAINTAFTYKYTLVEPPYLVTNGVHEFKDPVSAVFFITWHLLWWVLLPTFSHALSRSCFQRSRIFYHERCQRIEDSSLAQNLYQPPWLSQANSVPALPFPASYFPITKQEKERPMLVPSGSHLYFSQSFSSIFGKRFRRLLAWHKDQKD